MKTQDRSKAVIDSLEADLKDFEFEIMSDTNDLSDVPYIIPFKSHALNFITGGILGGKFIEVSGDSMVGKSYLLYELISSVQAMGGYALLQDGERAFSKNIALANKISMNGTFAITKERIIENLFPLMLKYILSIRKKDKTAPILIGLDSFPSLQTRDVMKGYEEGADPKGYAAMQKNLKFSQSIEKFVGDLDTYGATLILINQTRTKKGVVFGNPTYTLGEEVIKFWCTQRIRGRTAKKLNKKVHSTVKKEIEMQVGIRAEWHAIKNRHVAPFQKAMVQTLFSKGIDPFKGVDELLLNHNRISIETIRENKRAAPRYTSIETGAVYATISDLIDAEPKIIQPIMVGEIDSDDLVEEAIEDTEGAE